MTSDEELPKSPVSQSVDSEEVAKFTAMAAEWWDPHGKFRPLHKLNPVRLAFIRDEAARRFGRDPAARQPFAGLRLIDIGCGGGLLAEPMARLGFAVTAVDAGENNVKIAQAHAREQKLDIDYRHAGAEAVAEAGETFDVVLNMEVVEHAADADAFLRTCAGLIAPGGLMFIATINRTLKAYALAIVGAERVLRWLPRGTHRYDKFVRPIEIRDALKDNLTVRPPVGVSFNPLTDQWRLSTDTGVNYMLVCEKAGG